jgi:propanediol utilization protein
VQLPIPVHPAVRHVRLSTSHFAVLFGAQRLQRLLSLSSGTVASDGLVGVAGPAGELLKVRVLLPTVMRTEVHLLTRDALEIGLAAPGVDVDQAQGCTLHGPAGVVVLAAAVVNAERVVLPLPPADRVDLLAQYERPRLYRRVAVVRGERAMAFLDDDSGELRSTSTARLST